MLFVTSFILGALGLVAAAQDNPVPAKDAPSELTEPEVPLAEKIAQESVSLDSPESLYDLVLAIERSFELRISMEPLPEHCAGSPASEAPPNPFTIPAGEAFGGTLRRLEAAAQGRWVFEELHGIPLLRPDTSVDGHGTLLDTVVSVNIQARSLWEALCALARAVNQANEVHTTATRTLLITFAEPGLMKRPAPLFVEEKVITVSLEQRPSRDGLCSILAQAGKKTRYLYNCIAGGRPGNFDYITISAFDEDGKAVDGGRIRGEEFNQLLETEEWMSDEGILAVQAPGNEDASWRSNL